ncbi:hypothetical protein BLNAU_23979 [Blattamonas nauphoetae]|uniref:Uncharacterized protein n=1 Tax=Blattamonas nauphoetae TaxID=2049346 RepID=A0ABQ9WNP9_9EUKA|nr:hypothetical protein BLNAU_23979 [Blattamonas nauphoetae]
MKNPPDIGTGNHLCIVNLNHKNKTDNAEFFRAEVPYKTGSEPEDVWISPNLTHPIAPLPQFTHLLDIATSRIFIGITWDILHVASHHQNQVGGGGLMGARAVSGLSIALIDSSSPPPSEGATPFDHHVPEFDYRVREGAEAVQFVRERWSPSATSMSTEYITDRISLHAITMSLPPTDNKPLAQHKHVHCHDPRLETLLRSVELTDSANQKTESERDVEDKKQTQTEGACAGDQGEEAAEAVGETSQMVAQNEVAGG